MSEAGVVVTGAKDPAYEEARRVTMQIVANMEVAWNKGSAKQYASVFGPQVDVIDMNGGHGVGQAEVEKAYAALFGGAFKGSKVAYRIDKLKPLGAGVVVVFLTQQVTQTTDKGQAMALFRPTLTLRKVGAEWKISVFQNTRVQGAVRRAAAAGAAAGADKAAAKPAAKAAEPKPAAKPEAADAKAKPAAASKKK